MSTPIPIKVAEKIAKKYDYDQVIIYTRKTGDNGIEHMVTYGVNKEHCDAIAATGDHLKYEVMGWTREGTVSHEETKTKKDKK